MTKRNGPWEGERGEAKLSPVFSFPPSLALIFFFSRETPEYKAGSQSVRTRNDHQGRSALITKQLQINSI